LVAIIKIRTPARNVSANDETIYLIICCRDLKLNHLSRGHIAEAFGETVGFDGKCGHGQVYRKISSRKPDATAFSN
jgi:hypothetical protein